MHHVRSGNLLSTDSVKFLDKIMKQTSTGSDKLKAGITNNLALYHKTGSSSRLSNGIKIADNDAGYVILPDGKTYYIAVLIEN